MSIFPPLDNRHGPNNMDHLAFKYMVISYISTPYWVGQFYIIFIDVTCKCGLEWLLFSVRRCVRWTPTQIQKSVQDGQTTALWYYFCSAFECCTQNDTMGTNGLMTNLYSIKIMVLKEIRDLWPHKHLHCLWVHLTWTGAETTQWFCTKLMYAFLLA